MLEEKRFLTPPQAKLKGKSLLMNQDISNFLPLGKQKEILPSLDPKKYLGAKEYPLSAPPELSCEGLNMPLPKQAEMLERLGNWEGKGREKACGVGVRNEGPSGPRGPHRQRPPQRRGRAPPASPGGWRGPGMEPREGAQGEILQRCLIFRSHDDGSRSSSSIPALLK